MSVAAILPYPEHQSNGLPSLVLAAQRGDRDAFGLLYRRYERMVHGILVANAAWAEVEDLTQDVFIAAFENLASVRDPESFPAWLVAIARNTARGFHRRRRPLSQAVEIKDRADPRDDFGEQAFRVLELIKALPEAYRETLVLRLVEGMTGPEIAERTGLTPESVRVNLCRGMKLLREKLDHGR